MVCVNAQALVAFFIMDFPFTVHFVTEVLNKKAALYGITVFHVLKMELLYSHGLNCRYFLVKV